MTPQRTIDVSHLPPFEISSEAPLWWGQIFLAFIEGTMFSILLAMYFYLRLSVDVWPPPGTEMPRELLPAISLVLLLISCAGSYYASEGAKKDDGRAMIFGMLFNVGTAFIAMALRGISWSQWGFKWTASTYGSINWGILFLHTLDVAADLVFTVVLVIILALGKDGPRLRLGVHVDSLVWYALVAIWIPLYVAVFWGPHLVGAPR